MSKIPAAIFCLFIAACSHKGKKQAGNNINDSAIYFPYSPLWREWEADRKIYARSVLDIWKEYESGDLAHASGKFADHVKFIFPDVIIEGKRDSILSIVKKRRGNYSDMQCYVQSWLPVYQREKDEHVVLVWGIQDGTTKKGRRDYMVIHQIWKFDNQGKIRQMNEYITHPH